jgi:hypothetical protein
MSETNPDNLRQQRKDERNAKLESYFANRSIKTDINSAFQKEVTPTPVVATGRKFGSIAIPPVRESHK